MKLQHDLHFLQFLQFNGHVVGSRQEALVLSWRETRIPVRGELFLFLLGCGAAAGGRGRGRAQRSAGKGGAGAGQPRPVAGRTH